MLNRVCFVFAFASLAFSGCKARHTPESENIASTAPRKVLRIGIGGDPQFIDPQLQVGQPEFRVTNSLIEGLVSEGPAANQVLPGVAERWEISDDGLVYTFHLRADAKWSNGDPVTTENFVRAYQRMLNPALAADYVYMLFLVKGAEDYYHGKIKRFSDTGFRALDTHTLELTLVNPAPFFLNALKHSAWYPLPIATLEKFGDMDRRDATWTRPENFVGNGPFILKQWLLNQKIVVERSPTYWDRGHVKLDEIDFYPVELTDTEERMFRAGQLDVTYDVPLTKLAAYKRDAPQSLLIAPLSGIYFYRFNLARKPLDDVRVRRALALAIDRESIVKNITLADEVPAYAIVPPDTAGYISINHLHGDLAEAKRLLAEAGFPGGKGFPHLTVTYNTYERHRVVAEAIQEMWRRNLGIDVSLANEEWKVFEADQKAINFDISRGSWIADYLDPHVFFDTWRTGGGNNFTNWGSPVYDRLLDSALNTKNNTERYAIYNRMEKIIEDEVPIFPIYFYNQPRLIGPKVKTYRVTPLDNFPWKFVDMNP